MSVGKLGTFSEGAAKTIPAGSVARSIWGDNAVEIPARGIHARQYHQTVLPRQDQRLLPYPVNWATWKSVLRNQHCILRWTWPDAWDQNYCWQDSKADALAKGLNVVIQMAAISGLCTLVTST